jgi:hypothetical protein
MTREITSFNEPDVTLKFNEQYHTYDYNGKRLSSATSFVRKHTTPFPKDAVLDKCAANWGVPREDIAALWDSNGRIASGFGTALHEAMEHYTRYRTVGALILEASSKKENAALPNHPLLKRIILEYEALNPLDNTHQEYAEVIVSQVELGYCGLIDALRVTGDKRCRVQDYKITHNVEAQNQGEFLYPFDMLPRTKLSKYQLQLSFYADLLRLSGWDVEGLDVYVYGDEWVHYPMKPLELSLDTYVYDKHAMRLGLG